MENTPFKYKVFEVITIVFITVFCAGMFFKFMFF